MKKSMRIEALLLAIFAFCIFCCGPIALEVNAVVGVSSALIAVIIAALAAMGIIFTTTGAYSSLEDYVQSLFNEFASDRGTTVSSLMAGMQTGSNKLGQLIVNNRFLVVVETFGLWLQSKFSITDNSRKVVQSGSVNVGTIDVARLPVMKEVYVSNWNYYSDYAIETLRASRQCYVVTVEREYGMYIVISYAPAVVQYEVTNIDANGALINSFSRENELTKDDKSLDNYGLTIHDPELYYCFVQAPDGWLTAADGWAPVIPVESMADVVSVINGGGSEAGTSQITIVSGDITFPQDADDYDEGDGAVIDVQAGWGADYDDIVADIEGDHSLGNEDDATITYDEEAAVQEQVEDTPAQSVSEDAGEYQVTGLGDVFPFCIPFDLYNFVDCLAADPVAPSFQWRFYVPGIVDETITIDLSPYDSVAQLLRTMELLLFCVGLAFVTRKIIRG